MKRVFSVASVIAALMTTAIAEENAQPTVAGESLERATPTDAEKAAWLNEYLFAVRSEGRLNQRDASADAAYLEENFTEDQRSALEREIQIRENQRYGIELPQPQSRTQWLREYIQSATSYASRDAEADAAYLAENFPPEQAVQIQDSWQRFRNDADARNQPQPTADEILANLQRNQWVSDYLRSAARGGQRDELADQQFLETNFTQEERDDLIEQRLAIITAAESYENRPAVWVQNYLRPTPPGTPSQRDAEADAAYLAENFSPEAAARIQMLRENMLARTSGPTPTGSPDVETSREAWLRDYLQPNTPTTTSQRDAEADAAYLAENFSPEEAADIQTLRENLLARTDGPTQTVTSDVLASREAWLQQYWQDAQTGAERDEDADAVYMAANFPPEQATHLQTVRNEFLQVRERAELQHNRPEAWLNRYRSDIYRGVSRDADADAAYMAENFTPEQVAGITAWTEGFYRQAWANQYLQDAETGAERDADADAAYLAANFTAEQAANLTALADQRVAIRTGQPVATSVDNTDGSTGSTAGSNNNSGSNANPTPDDTDLNAPPTTGNSAQPATEPLSDREQWLSDYLQGLASGEPRSSAEDRTFLNSNFNPGERAQINAFERSIAIASTGQIETVSFDRMVRSVGTNIPTPPQPPRVSPPGTIGSDGGSGTVLSEEDQEALLAFIGNQDAQSAMQELAALLTLVDAYHAASPDDKADAFVALSTAVSDYRTQSSDALRDGLETLGAVPDDVEDGLSRLEGLDAIVAGSAANSESFLNFVETSALLNDVDFGDAATLTDDVLNALSSPDFTRTAGELAVLVPDPETDQFFAMLSVATTKQNGEFAYPKFLQFNEFLTEQGREDIWSDPDMAQSIQDRYNQDRAAIVAVLNRGANAGFFNEDTVDGFRGLDLMWSTNDDGSSLGLLLATMDPADTALIPDLDVVDGDWGGALAALAEAAGLEIPGLQGITPNIGSPVQCSEACATAIENLIAHFGDDFLLAYRFGTTRDNPNIDELEAIADQNRGNISASTRINASTRLTIRNSGKSSTPDGAEEAFADGIAAALGVNPSDITIIGVGNNPGAVANEDDLLADLTEQNNNLPPPPPPPSPPPPPPAPPPPPPPNPVEVALLDDLTAGTAKVYQTLLNLGGSDAGLVLSLDTRNGRVIGRGTGGFGGAQNTSANYEIAFSGMVGVDAGVVRGYLIGGSTLLADGADFPFKQTVAPIITIVELPLAAFYDDEMTFDLEFDLRVANDRDPVGSITVSPDATLLTDFTPGALTNADVALSGFYGVNLFDRASGQLIDGNGTELRVDNLITVNPANNTLVVDPHAFTLGQALALEYVNERFVNPSAGGVDGDGDGLTDFVEDILDSDDTVFDVDSDGDGLTDTEEEILFLNPNSADSDGDGTSDFAEVTSGNFTLPEPTFTDFNVQTAVFGDRTFIQTFVREVTPPGGSSDDTTTVLGYISGTPVSGFSYLGWGEASYDARSEDDEMGMTVERLGYVTAPFVFGTDPTDFADLPGAGVNATYEGDIRALGIGNSGQSAFDVGGDITLNVAFGPNTISGDMTLAPDSASGLANIGLDIANGTFDASGIRFELQDSTFGPTSTVGNGFGGFFGPVGEEIGGIFNASFSAIDVNVGGGFAARTDDIGGN